MMWVLRKWYLQWQIAKVMQADEYLDKLYHFEKRCNARALKSLHARLENLPRERMRAALGKVPL